MLRELMKAKASKKRNPEFHEVQTELAHKLQWASNMKEAGRLTGAEYEEFESHLVTDYLSSLPMETYAEMRKDGTFDDLEALAGFNGKRHGDDVRNDRKAIDRKITKDALDEAWASGKIDDERYASENRSRGFVDNDDVKQRMTDGDTNVSGEIFFGRNCLDLNAPTEPAQSEMETYVAERKAQDAGEE